MGYNLSKLKEFYLKDESLNIPNIPKDFNLCKNVIFRGNFQNKDVKNNYIDEFITKLNKKLPLVSYMETKTNSDILYSHPEFLDLNFDNFANVKGIISFKKITKVFQLTQLISGMITLNSITSNI